MLDCRQLPGSITYPDPRRSAMKAFSASGERGTHPTFSCYAGDLPLALVSSRHAASRSSGFLTNVVNAVGIQSNS